MAHDGTAGLSPAGWLPDRVSVGVLVRTFPPALVDQVVTATETQEVRRRLLPSQLVVYFVLALWLFRGRNCGYAQVLSKLVDGLSHRRHSQLRPDEEQLIGVGWVDAGENRRIPNISSLARARVRLGAAPLHMLFNQVAGPVGVDGEAGVFGCGLRMISIDGCPINVPDTPANNEFFGQPGKGARSGAFPQVRWLAAAESGTGALIGATFGPYPAGDQPLARDLLTALAPGMLVLAGRDFLSHTLAREVLATGAHILWQAPVRFELNPIMVLPDETYLTKLYPASYTVGSPPITIRVIKYTGPITPDGGTEPSTKLFLLITDLLDIGIYPAVELIRSYLLRWEAGTVIGHYKTDLGADVAVLRSKDPEGVAQELWALFAVYQAFRPFIGASSV